MTSFNPEQHGFVKLHDFQLGGKVDVYEYMNHPAADGTHDFLRLNTYLSKDNAFVNIWSGLMEPLFAEIRFEKLVKQHGFNFGDMYNEELFRGYIETTEDAVVILRAAGISTGVRCACPQILEGAPDELRCEKLPVPTQS